MSNSEKDDDLGVVISKGRPSLTPPGYEIQLSTEQAVAIAEWVNTPIYKLLKNVYVAQRKDHIARSNLNSSQTLEQLFYFKGMAAELQLFFKNMENVKKAIDKADEQAQK